MKKLLLAIIILVASLGLHAQDKECNRLFLHQKGKDAAVFNTEKIDSIYFAKKGIADNLIVQNSNGTKDEFAVDNIDSLTFKNVEGRVAADIEVLSYTENSATLNITRTPSCVGFKMVCFPYEDVVSFSTKKLVSIINDNITTIYYEDFKEEVVTDLVLEPNTEYAFFTVGIDEYGLLCDLTKKRFATANPDLVGDPQVDIEVVDNNLYDLTLKFTPNADASKYCILIGEEGEIEVQYTMFAYAFGWNTIKDMVKDWGFEFTGVSEYQYLDMAPNTIYEVYILAWDINGVTAPYTIFKFKSKSTGGEGIAKVDIELGKYALTEWPYEDTTTITLPSQFITFTPNDQTSAYRYNVVLEENYLKDIDGYQEDLCSEPFTTTLNWFQYETLTTDFQIDPGTKCVAIAAARNTNNEWGPVTELFFTTPDEMPDECMAPAKRFTDDKKTKVRPVGKVITVK